MHEIIADNLLGGPTILPNLYKGRPGELLIEASYEAIPEYTVDFTMKWENLLNIEPSCCGFFNRVVEAEM